jgi:hypothetical protein
MHMTQPNITPTMNFINSDSSRYHNQHSISPWISSSQSFTTQAQEFLLCAFTPSGNPSQKVQKFKQEESKQLNCPLGDLEWYSLTQMQSLFSTFKWDCRFLSFPSLSILYSHRFLIAPVIKPSGLLQSHTRSQFPSAD